MLAIVSIGMIPPGASDRGPAVLAGHGTLADLAIFIGGGVATLGIYLLLVGWRRRAAAARAGEEIGNRELKDVLEHQPCYVGLLSADGTLLWCNEPPLRDSGLSLKDVVGRKFWDTPWWSHDPAMANAIRAGVLEAARGESPRFETTVARADGPPMAVDFRVARVLDESGRVRFLVPAALDLTDRKHAEEALLAAERRMRTIFEQSSDPMSISDAGRRIVEVNPSRLRRARLHA